MNPFFQQQEKTLFDHAAVIEKLSSRSWNKTYRLVTPIHVKAGEGLVEVFDPLRREYVAVMHVDKDGTLIEEVALELEILS